MKPSLLKAICHFVPVLIICAQTAYSQRSNTFSLSANFLQLKEGLNQGMFFNGGQILFQYAYKKIIPSCELTYQPGIGLGWAFIKGMHATQLNLAIADISCIKPVFKTEKHIIKIGGNFTGNYNYNRYPYLQSGHLFWVTEIGVGPRVDYSFLWKQHRLNITFINSVAGLTSRPDPEPDPYFYSLRFADYIKYAHSNLLFGSFDHYDRTRFALEYLPNTQKRHSIAAGVDYFGLSYDPRFQRLIYFIQWNKTFTK